MAGRGAFAHSAQSGWAAGEGADGREQGSEVDGNDPRSKEEQPHADAEPSTEAGDMQGRDAYQDYLVEGVPQEKEQRRQRRQRQQEHAHRLTKRY
eukprot:COSAG01_NODE_2361_length_7832_cov_12.919447_9_plen_95_part_00